MTEPSFIEEAHDFSVVLGGPLFQAFRRSHLTGDSLELLHRRLLLITLFAWLPLAILAIILGPSAESLGRLSFFHDVEVHVRFLVALPVLIGAELIVHSRTRPVVRRFVERRIVVPQDLPRFDSAIKSAIRLRNSVPAEIALLIIAFVFGPLLWNIRVVSGPTWYAASGGRWHLTPAGYWYVFVSIPILRFILLRWYLRLFIWFRFLWQVSRLNLHLVSTHPDRAAGLAFLGKSAYAFGPILFAQGAMLAGLVASRVLYNGESLLSFKLQIGGFIVFFVLAILGPLLMFTPGMARARRKGLADYGLLAQRYVNDFEQRWVLSNSAPPEELLGAADIQSLADLGNSYAMVREMRAVPFGLDDISRLAAATAAPLVPLLLTIFSPEELIMRIIKVVF